MDTVTEEVDESVFSDVGAQASEATQLVASGEVELGAVVVDIDKVWDDEERKVARFVAGGCSCQLGPRTTLRAISSFLQQSAKINNVCVCACVFVCVCACVRVFSCVCVCV